MGMASSPVEFSAYDHSGRPSAQSEPQTNRRYHPGDDGAQSQQCTWNLCHGGRDDHKGCNLSLEGSGPKAIRGTVRNSHFPRHFRAPNNIARYTDKTNTSIWLEDYRLMSSTTIRSTKMGAKGGKKGQKHRLCHLATMASNDDDREEV
jgi:hypothetical protein